MSVAGKVAITLDPDVEWSVEKTYDKLVAVRYQNKLYISRKPSTNVLPTDNEYWMLAVSGAEVETMTSEVMGVAKPDNDTITVKDGVIKAEINKEILDKLGESDKGTLTFNGSEIKGTPDYVFDTFEEAEAAVKAGLVEEGANVYVKEDSDSIPEMTGATADKDGRGGTVPAPKAGQENHVLKGNGAWEPLEYDSELSAESENAPKTKVVEARAREIETNLSRLSNPNLLINPDFKINQRGGKISNGNCTVYVDENLTSVNCTNFPHIFTATKITNGNYTFTNEYGTFYVSASDVVDGYCEINGSSSPYSIDRWQIVGCKLTIFSDRINIANIIESFNSYIQTKIELSKKIYQNSIFTYTVSTSRGIISVIGKIGTVNVKNDVIIGSNWENDEVSRFYIQNANNTLDNGFDIEWVKLELGSVATPFVPPDPATELLKCQRYYETGVDDTFSYAPSTGFNISSYVPYTVEKRVIPTVTSTVVAAWRTSKNIGDSMNLDPADFDLKKGMNFYNDVTEIGEARCKFKWIADAEIYR